MAVVSPAITPAANGDGVPRKLPNGHHEENYYKPFPPNHFAPKDGDQKLDIGIVGAGIAGLTAAVALLQCGHNVEVSGRPSEQVVCRRLTTPHSDVREV